MIDLIDVIMLIQVNATESVIYVHQPGFLNQVNLKFMIVPHFVTFVLDALLLT